MIWTLFYYNSLPDMPKECLLFSRDVMHRDFFKCNPSNTNHYQYPKFETLSYDVGCHCREVNQFLNNDDPDKYILFYTRHTNIVGEMKNKLIGYFKVGEKFKIPQRGFYAAEAVLIKKNKCIDIEYTARGVPVSWGNSTIVARVNKILNYLLTKVDSPENIMEVYKKETEKIMEKLITTFGRNEIVEVCEKCKVNEQCFWGRKKYQYKRKRLADLYGNKQQC